MSISLFTTLFTTLFIINLLMKFAESFSININTKIGIIIVDHGSRKSEANDMLNDVVNRYKQISPYRIIEAAHMELAEPSIQTAYNKCVEQGATHIICHPYFLSIGRHVQEDIPTLLSNAASQHKDTTYILTKPLGMQNEIVDLISKSISDSIS